MRGCGLPDAIIDTLPALLGSVIDRYTCFISYSSRDHDFVERLHADLQQRGVRCQLDRRDLKTGDRFQPAIFEAMRTHDTLLLVLSEYSVVSEWVGNEIAKARSEERKQGRDILFPIRLDDAVFEQPSAWAEAIRNTRHITDFSGSTEPDTYAAALKKVADAAGNPIVHGQCRHRLVRHDDAPYD